MPTSWLTNKVLIAAVNVTQSSVLPTHCHKYPTLLGNMFFKSVSGLHCFLSPLSPLAIIWVETFFRPIKAAELLGFV